MATLTNNELTALNTLQHIILTIRSTSQGSKTGVEAIESLKRIYELADASHNVLHCFREGSNLNLENETMKMISVIV